MQIRRLHPSRIAVGLMNLIVDFLAMNGDVARRLNPQAHFISADVDHGDVDVISDDDRFVSLTGQNQHAVTFLARAAAKLLPWTPPIIAPVGGNYAGGRPFASKTARGHFSWVGATLGMRMMT
jgi:hypothetical protein